MAIHMHRDVCRFLVAPHSILFRTVYETHSTIQNNKLLQFNRYRYEHWHYKMDNAEEAKNLLRKKYVNNMEISFDSN